MLAPMKAGSLFEKVNSCSGLGEAYLKTSIVETRAAAQDQDPANTLGDHMVIPRGSEDPGAVGWQLLLKEGLECQVHKVCMESESFLSVLHTSMVIAKVQEPSILAVPAHRAMAGLPKGPLHCATSLEESYECFCAFDLIRFHRLISLLVLLQRNCCCPSASVYESLRPKCNISCLSFRWPASVRLLRHASVESARLHGVFLKTHFA